MSVSADPAQDGASWTYNMSDAGAAGVENFTVTLTGVESRSWDNVSASTLLNGESFQYQVGGNANATGPNGSPTVTLTGTTESRVASWMGTDLGSGGSTSVTVDGNLAPTGESVTFHGVETTTQQSWSTAGASTGDTKDITVGGNIPAENGLIQFTGVETTTRQTWSGAGSGTTIAVDGNAPPQNATISFEGQVPTNSRTVSGASGSSVSVGGNLDPTGPSTNNEPTVTLEGRGSNTAAIASGIDGDTVSVSGNLEPTNAQVTLTGRTTTTSNDYSWSNIVATYGTFSRGISVDGNLDPTGPSSNNEPEIEITGRTLTANAFDTQDTIGPANRFHNYGIPVPNGGTITDLDIRWSRNSLVDGGHLEIYLERGMPDQTLDTGSMTYVGSFTPPSGQNSGTANVGISDFDPGGYSYVTVMFLSPDSGRPVIPMDSTDEAALRTDDSSTYNQAADITAVSEPGNVNVDLDNGESYYAGFIGSGGTQTVELPALDTSVTEITIASNGGEFDASLRMNERSATEDPSVDIDGDGTAEATAAGVFTQGQTTTLSLSELTTGTQTVDTGSSSGPAPDWSLDYTERTATEDPSVDIDGDGSPEASATGVYQAGDTVTVEVPSLATGDSTVTTSAGSGPVPDYSFSFTERTATEDPSVDIDGDGTPDASHNGILTTGQTSQLSLPNLGTGTPTVDTSTTAGTTGWTITADETFITEDPSVDLDGDGAPEASYNGQIAPGASASVPISELTAGSRTVETSTGAGVVDWTITADAVTATKDPAVDLDGDGSPDASYTGVIRDGETQTVDTAGLAIGTQQITTTLTSGRASWNLTATERMATEDPAVDLDGDGTAEASVSGLLSDGETRTFDIGPLATGTHTASMSTTGWSSATVELTLQERTVTEDATVNINGQTITHAGQLADGETATYTADASWIQPGENTVSVSAAPSLSSDAPTARVGISYEHTARSKQTANYTATEWTESYEVSHTYAGNRESASLTIPFQKSVVAVRDLEVRRDGQTWSPVDTPGYTLEETNLTVAFGAVEQAERVSVRVTGVVTRTSGGSIEVLDPSVAGEDLNTAFAVSSRVPGEPLAIDVGNTSRANVIHYIDAATWNQSSSWVSESTGGQRVVMQNATADGEATMRTLPVSVSVETGDVEVTVIDPDPTAPTFAISPGEYDGDELTIAYHNTTTGETYRLQSVSRGIQLAEDEAESPAIFDISDEPQIVRIEHVDGSENASVAGGAGPSDGTSNERGGFFTGNLVSILLAGGAGLGLLIAVVLVVGRLRRSHDSDTETGTQRDTNDGRGGVSGLIGRLAGGVGTVITTVGSMFLSLLGVGFRILKQETWLAGGVVMLTAISLGAGGLIPAATVRVLILVGLLAGVPLFMRRVGVQSLALYALVAAGILVFGAELVAPGVLTTTITTLGPIVVVIGGAALLLYLWNRRKDAGTPDEVNTIQFEGATVTRDAMDTEEGAD
ncbi:hypothetical protein [Halosegnis marinus]|uniref:Uncharacterized protein n=2 Tax=Halosegnis marinus TaxID=3034023 RepID=A0ABD5ZT64_9EURY